MYSLGYRIFDSGGFNAWFPEHIHPGTMMTSYFQYYPPLKPYESDIRELFVRGLCEFRDKFTRDYSNCAFLHVDHDFNDVKMLFEIIDTKNDGYIDENEFDDNTNSEKNNIYNEEEQCFEKYDVKNEPEKKFIKIKIKKSKKTLI